MERYWNDARLDFPKESGFYYVYVDIQTDLGLSHFHDIAQFNFERSEWTSDELKKAGGTITFWTELLDNPQTFI